MKYNVGNLTALFTKFSDIYTIILVAFSNNVEWYPGAPILQEQQVKTISFLEGEYVPFLFIMIVCTCTAIIYLVLVYYAQDLLKKDIFGCNDDGEPAKFPHIRWVQSQMLQQLGGTLFLTMMKTFIDGFICRWDGDGPWYMTRTLPSNYVRGDDPGENAIECLSSEHITIMGVSIVGLLVYYPVSTYMFPNFQFANKALDVKWDPSFLVVYIQIKLIVIGTNSFFASYQTSSDNTFYNIIQTGVIAIFMIFLSIFNLLQQPCMIQWVNIFESSLYFISAILNGVGCIILLLDMPILGPIVALPLIIIVIITSLIRFKIYRNKYRQIVPQQKSDDDAFDIQLDILEEKKLSTSQQMKPQKKAK